MKKGDIFAEKIMKMLYWSGRIIVMILILTTKHTIDKKSVTVQGREVIKPEAIIEYNVGKVFIDFTDQMGAYSSCLRRSVKWCHKVVLDLLLNMCV